MLDMPQPVRRADERVLPEKREAPSSGSSPGPSSVPSAADAGAKEGVKYPTDNGGQQQRARSDG